MRKTKIVCTIGPASQSPDVLRRLIESGMNATRLNFFHGDHAFHSRVFCGIRDLSERLKIPFSVLQNLAGPKIRIGPLEGDRITLETGSIFELTDRKVQGNAERVSTTS